MLRSCRSLMRISPPNKKAHPATIWRRAAEERSTEERKCSPRELLEKAREKVVYSQSEQLARCNARHLELAEKLESAVNQRLERAPELSENALRNLATVSEAAQRISRLALGVSTENLHTSHDPYAQMSDEELAQELERFGIEPAVQ